jgi:NADPH2:quinone reductase
MRAAVDPAMAFPLPETVSFRTGAALPMNYLTTHYALTRRGQLRPGETLLVHGAAGGIGTASIQLGRALGAHVIAVVSTPEKGEVATTAGAHDVVMANGFLESVRTLTDGRGVDLIVDPVGGDRFTDSLRSLAREGRLLVIGFTGGEIPTVKVNRLLNTNTTVMGVGWAVFWIYEREYLARQWDELLPLMDSGAIDPIIGSVYPLDQAATALGAIEDRSATGKLVLELP